MTNYATPSDTLKTTNHEIFMSYARLLRVVSLFPNGLTDLTEAHADPAILTAVIEILLADKGVEPKDYPRADTYELSMKDGDAISEWGLAHAFDFFARKVEATLQAAKAAGDKIKDVTERTEALTQSTLSSNGTSP